MFSNMEEEFEPERIIDKQRENGKEFYKVIWKGYPVEDATWEPSENVLPQCAGLILDFDHTFIFEEVKDIISRRVSGRIPYRIKYKVKKDVFKAIGIEELLPKYANEIGDYERSGNQGEETDFEVLGRNIIDNKILYFIRRTEVCSMYIEDLLPRWAEMIQNFEKGDGEDALEENSDSEMYESAESQQSNS